METRHPLGNRAAILRLVVAIVALVVTTAACARTTTKSLNIFAAASLTQVFPAYDNAERYNFAGSNALETQIRNGAPADIFASASPVNAQRLFASGLVERPVTFTANRLALIVPKSNPARLHSVYDLKTKKVKLVVADAGVPVGKYTRAVLARLGLGSVLAKVVSQESDVKAVTGKVALGQADAGFVYITDARAVRARVATIAIPDRAQPRVRYEIAVVSRSPNKVAARSWIKGILAPRGQAALKRAGFQPLPRGPS